MTVLLVVAAAIAGYVLHSRIVRALARIGIKDKSAWSQLLGKLTYDDLLRFRKVIEDELSNRQPPPA